MMGEATRQEHLYAQDFKQFRLQTAIRIYSRVVRERPTSAEAYAATERLKALNIPVPAPDTSYTIVEQNKALDIEARQKFIDDTLVGYTRRLVQRGLPLVDVQRSMLATTIEQLSKLRRPDLCKTYEAGYLRKKRMIVFCHAIPSWPRRVMPGCNNVVTGHELCQAHTTEINTYCENVAKQIKVTDLAVTKYIAQIQQVNTLEAYSELARFLDKVIRDKIDISDTVRSRAYRAITDGKKSLERANAAALHLRFIPPTGPEAAD